MIKKPFTNKGALGKFSEAEEPIKPTHSGYSFKAEMNNYDNSQGQSNLVPCRRCGRTFMADRISKHERVCKADPVEKHKP